MSNVASKREGERERENRDRDLRRGKLLRTLFGQLQFIATSDNGHLHKRVNVTVTVNVIVNVNVIVMVIVNGQTSRRVASLSLVSVPKLEQAQSEEDSDKSKVQAAWRLGFDRLFNWLRCLSKSLPPAPLQLE